MLSGIFNFVTTTTTIAVVLGAINDISSKEAAREAHQVFIAAEADYHAAKRSLLAATEAVIEESRAGPQHITAECAQVSDKLLLAVESLRDTSFDLSVAATEAADAEALRYKSDVDLLEHYIHTADTFGMGQHLAISSISRMFADVHETGGCINWDGVMGSILPIHPT